MPPKTAFAARTAPVSPIYPAPLRERMAPRSLPPPPPIKRLHTEYNTHLLTLHDSRMVQFADDWLLSAGCWLGTSGFHFGGGGGNRAPEKRGGGFGKRAQLTGPLISYYELWRQRRRKDSSRDVSRAARRPGATPGWTDTQFYGWSQPSSWRRSQLTWSSGAMKRNSQENLPPMRLLLPLLPLLLLPRPLPLPLPWPQAPAATTCGLCPRPGSDYCSRALPPPPPPRHAPLPLGSTS